MQPPIEGVEVPGQPVDQDRAGQALLNEEYVVAQPRFQEMAEKLGIKVKSVYYILGQYDMVAVMEGSDEAAMVALLKVASLGNARFQTMRAFSVDEMKGFISKMS